MLKMAGGTTLGLGIPGRVLAIFQDGSIIVQDHRVPADKKLTAAWKKSLTARGTKEVWSGKELDSIGMPIGGIAAGQMYLCGDGTLGCWEIFNKHDFQSYGSTSYAKRDVPKPVEFGFALKVEDKVWNLDKTGFKNVTFEGTHPMAKVTYSDPDCPIEATLVAYTPFIPMNEKDSGLPATFFEFEFKNTSSRPVSFEIIGSLENAVARSGEKSPGDRKRHSKAFQYETATILVHSADPAKDEFGIESDDPRPAILLAGFEDGNYGSWKLEGEAFGTAPAQGTLPDQNPVSDFEGKGLVNTFFKGDGTKGRLTSPEFPIQRKYLNFKIGGGNHPDQECVNLIVDGKVVRTATGLNDEKLLWETWSVDEYNGKLGKIEIVDQATGGWGHINVDHIELSDRIRSRADVQARRGNNNLDQGTLALGLLNGPKISWDHTYGLAERFVGVITSDAKVLSPGKAASATFVLGWHFPHHRRGRQYANWFKSAGDVVMYGHVNHTRLKRDTKLWRDTYYDSTLPYWLLDRLHSTMGNLATGTTEWWESGRFWAWEGVVCCSGTCTHVWNYEHGLARLWPSIERNVRERQDFGEAFDEKTGLVGFRSDRQYAADGQCGTVLKAYREHLISADDKFLSRNWPKIKKSLEFLIAHDTNGDGMIEDAQPNTYDIDFFGANTFVGALYLAALRAGEEMARELGETDFANDCHELFEKGSAATVQQLWNGEYFIQDVDQSVHKEFQYGPGCLSDQLFGQGWAHQVGLGHLYPADKVKTALSSVWKYNWAPDVEAQNKRWKPERPFAVPGEAGLFICTWPTGGREKDPVRYRDEVWTGIEYQVAGHMIWEGMVEEGLSICKAIHERYHPAKRNPYNEVECSDHYARAMASWGVLTALSGFEYHGPKGRIGFSPKVTPTNFRSPFTVADGWGTFEQRVQGTVMTAKLTLKFGVLALERVVLDALVKGVALVKLAGKTVPARTVLTDGRLSVEFEKPVEMSENQELSFLVNSIEHPSS